MIGKRKKKKEIIRIKELEEQLAQSGEEVDEETVISMYMPRRRREIIAASLLRMDKMRLALILVVFLLAFLFIASFMQEKMGNFTINLNRLELYRKGISISETGDFKEATARLVANTVQDATNISIKDLPENLDEIDGDHNGRNYVAYTYYVRNAGKEDVGYVATVRLDSCAKGAEDAVRVAIWRNGERTVFAEPAWNGGEEEGCVSFLNHDLVCAYEEPEFLVGNVDRYTIVIWMEGEDPDCVDSIIGGSVQFSMHIDSDTEDDTSLFWKFVTDIKDTISGNKPISASGNEAPNEN